MNNNIIYHIQGCQGGGGVAPPPFPFPQGFWDDSGGNGDTGVPSAKECAVVVGGGGVVFEMQ